MEAMPFHDAFELVDTLILEQSDSLPIVRVSGVDVDTSGTILLSDAAEGRIRLHGRRGELLRVMGGKGSGPKEFQQPFAPRFGSDGQIHVPDAALRRISVFDRAGSLRRQIKLEGFVLLSGLEVLPNGRGYLVAGIRSEKQPMVLHHLDTLGVEVSSYLPLRNFVPAGERESILWNSVRMPVVARRGSTVLAGLSIADSLWTVDLETGKVASTHVRPPGYERPSSPPGDVRDSRSVVRWSRSFSRMAPILATDSMVLVPFVRGVMNEGDPVMAAYQGPDGRWRSLPVTPAVMRAGNGMVVALHNPGEDAVKLALYRQKR